MSKGKKKIRGVIQKVHWKGKRTQKTMGKQTKTETYKRDFPE